MNTTPRSPFGNRYPAKYMLRAQELHAADWSVPAIARLLGREFEQEPSTHIVRIWVNPKHRERNRAAQRRRWRERHPTPRVPAPLARMQRLHEAGLSSGSIAKVMELDFGMSISAEQVRYSLKTGSLPRSARVEVGGRG